MATTITLRAALALTTLDGLDDIEALEALGLVIDHAGDTDDHALIGKAFAWIEGLKARTLSDALRVNLDYFEANAWAHRHKPKQTDRQAVWAWDQEELEQQILCLRRAWRNPAFAHQAVVQRCAILTNLANQLDTIGRTVEARQLWDEALVLEPKFWMARANRGSALISYSRCLFVGDHQSLFALHAHREITRAIDDLDLRPDLGWIGLRPEFASKAAAIAGYYRLDVIEKDLDLKAGNLGQSEEEISYRRWCLRETLFLNPLNDISKEAGAAADSLTLPSMIIGLHQAPVEIGFYNQLKQEFVTARWSYYVGHIAADAHFSDYRVELHNTLDDPIYGLAVEQIKLAFRVSYSLFDKIAYFLNRYLKLGVDERKVNFRNIWREKQNAPIRQTLEASENWPFRGLYWMSKDFFAEGFRDFTEPDARGLAELRNHLEHKYLKVHRYRAPTPSAISTLPFDDFAHSISLADLETRTLRLLKLARAALIYLALGVHREEKRRRAGIPPGLIASVGPYVIEDEWKARF